MAHLRIVANIKRGPREEEMLLLIVLLLWVLLEELVELLTWYELGCSHHQRGQDLVVAECGCISLRGISGPYVEYCLLFL